MEELRVFLTIGLHSRDLDPGYDGRPNVYERLEIFRAHRNWLIRW